jgi:RNA polymerase sigma-70 factor, ECF subfamily
VNKTDRQLALMTIPPSPTVLSAHPDVKSLSTQQLLVLAQADQWLALQELVHRYQKPVFITLFLLLPNSHSATELTQAVLVLMCRNIKSLTNLERFKFWLNQLLLTQLQEANPHSLQTNLMTLDTPYKASHDQPFTRTVSNLHSNQSLDDDRQCNPVYQAMITLPKAERLLLVLREVQGLSYEDIASLTSMPLAKVQQGLAQARILCQPVFKQPIESSAPLS